MDIDRIVLERASNYSLIDQGYLDRIHSDVKTPPFT
jgi:hypothetical protein